MLGLYKLGNLAQVAFIVLALATLFLHCCFLPDSFAFAPP
jgi:hypothetical protein